MSSLADLRLKGKLRAVERPLGISLMIQFKYATSIVSKMQGASARKFVKKTSKCLSKNGHKQVAMRKNTGVRCTAEGKFAFGIHSGSVWPPFGVRWESVRGPFGVRLGSVRSPFGVRYRGRSGSVHGPFGNFPSDVTGIFLNKIFNNNIFLKAIWRKI